MALTEKQIYDLNNMNVAAQNVQLGTVIDSIPSSPTVDKGVKSAKVTLDSSGKITALAITLNDNSVVNATIETQGS